MYPRYFPSSRPSGEKMTVAGHPYSAYRSSMSGRASTSTLAAMNLASRSERTDASWYVVASITWHQWHHSAAPSSTTKRCSVRALANVPASNVSPTRAAPGAPREPLSASVLRGLRRSLRGRRSRHRAPRWRRRAWRSASRRGPAAEKSRKPRPRTCEAVHSPHGHRDYAPSLPPSCGGRKCSRSPLARGPIDPTQGLGLSLFAVRRAQIVDAPPRFARPGLMFARRGLGAPEEEERSCVASVLVSRLRRPFSSYSCRRPRSRSPGRRAPADTAAAPRRTSTAAGPGGAAARRSTRTRAGHDGRRRRRSRSRDGDDQPPSTVHVDSPAAVSPHRAARRDRRAVGARGSVAVQGSPCDQSRPHERRDEYRIVGAGLEPVRSRSSSTRRTETRSRSTSRPASTSKYTAGSGSSSAAARSPSSAASSRSSPAPTSKRGPRQRRHDEQHEEHELHLRRHGSDPRRRHRRDHGRLAGRRQRAHARSKAAGRDRREKPVTMGKKQRDVNVQAQIDVTRRPTWHERAPGPRPAPATNVVPLVQGTF